MNSKRCAKIGDTFGVGHATIDTRDVSLADSVGDLEPFSAAPPYLSAFPMRACLASGRSIVSERFSRGHGFGVGFWIRERARILFRMIAAVCIPANPIAKHALHFVRCSRVGFTALRARDINAAASALFHDGVDHVTFATIRRTKVVFNAFIPRALLTDTFTAFFTVKKNDVASRAIASIMVAYEFSVAMVTNSHDLSIPAIGTIGK